MLQRTLPAGFIAPCLPTRTDKAASGRQWLHEIKHDGFRVIARKAGVRVRLYSRPGNDLTYRFPLIVESLARLRSRSCHRRAGGRTGSQARGGRGLGQREMVVKKKTTEKTRTHFSHRIDMWTKPDAQSILE